MFLKLLLKKWATKAKINKWGYTKLKFFGTARESFNKTKRPLSE